MSLLTAPSRVPAGAGAGLGQAAATPPGGGPGSAVAPPAPGSKPAATLALALLTVASAAGLFRVFSNHSWVGPVAATIVVVHLVCWGLRRVRLGQLISAPVVAVAVVLMAVWTVLGRSTTFGFPTGRTWHAASTALGDLSNEIATLIAPVAPTRTFELLAVAGAGAAAALADWAAFRWKSPLLALIPGIATFIFCCTSGQGRGRGLVIGLEVGAVCLFLLVERAGATDTQVWFAGTRAGVASSAAVAGGIIASVGVIVAIALSPALPARDGAGTLGWRNGLGAGGGERIVPNPLVSLRADLTQFSNTPVFRVQSSQASYWRLTSLNSFDGIEWTSKGQYESFGGHLPGAPPAGALVRTVGATFVVQQLDSVWLPAQFDPISVHGVRHVTYDPASNSLLDSGSTTTGLTYSVTSYQRLDSLSAPKLEAAPNLDHDPIAAQNLFVPKTVPFTVETLALDLTSRLTTEYDKALAIQGYLRSSRFTYTTSPRLDGSGNQALSDFLFQTRAGYCQQFAGAFAVLARLSGLPTRLAVGFDTGQALSNGSYEVLDRDAHTWPEIWFGAALGWVPFEPTPGFAVPGTSGYSNTGGNGRGPGTTSPTTTPSSPNTTSPEGISKPPRTVPSASSTTRAAAPSGKSSGGASAWWLVLPGLVMTWLALNGAGPSLLRKRRRRLARRDGPEAVVLNAWSEVASDLLWIGISRQPDETDDEFAVRAATSLHHRGVTGGWADGGLQALGAMARRASFATSVPDGLGSQAFEAAAEIRRKLAAETSWQQRVARLWSRPPGRWRRVKRAVG